MVLPPSRGVFFYVLTLHLVVFYSRHVIPTVCPLLTFSFSTPWGALFYFQMWFYSHTVSWARCLQMHIYTGIYWSCFYTVAPLLLMLCLFMHESIAVSMVSHCLGTSKHLQNANISNVVGVPCTYLRLRRSRMGCVETRRCCKRRPRDPEVYTQTGGALDPTVETHILVHCVHIILIGVILYEFKCALGKINPNLVCR